MDSILASHPEAPGLIPGIPEVFSLKFFWETIFNVARLIDIALANGKLVLLKLFTDIGGSNHDDDVT